MASHGADVLFTHWQSYDQTQPLGVDADTPTRLQRELRGFGVRAEELALGVGGLILGVWGIRSVLMPTSIATVTAIDLALSWVILLLLLGFALRAALHFHRHSDLPLPGSRRKP